MPVSALAAEAHKVAAMRTHYAAGIIEGRREQLVPVSLNILKDEE